MADRPGKARSTPGAPKEESFDSAAIMMEVISRGFNIDIRSATVSARCSRFLIRLDSTQAVLLATVFDLARISSASDRRLTSVQSRGSAGPDMEADVGRFRSQTDTASKMAG